MPCDTRLKPRQTIKQRADEVRAVVARISTALASGKVKTVIGPTGGVAFTGLSDEERDGVTDACAYRRVMATGSALAKAAIAKAEALSGRSINKQSVAHGHHAHEIDGKLLWHDHKG
jgi:hypothetical protein